MYIYDTGFLNVVSVIASHYLGSWPVPTGRYTAKKKTSGFSGGRSRSSPCNNKLPINHVNIVISLTLGQI